MNESKVAVLPVPEGISSKQCPYKIESNFNWCKFFVIHVEVRIQSCYLCIKGSLELQHIFILLGINVFVWEIHQQTVYTKPIHRNEKQLFSKRRCKENDVNKFICLNNAYFIFVTAKWMPLTIKTNKFFGTKLKWFVACVWFHSFMQSHWTDNIDRTQTFQMTFQWNCQKWEILTLQYQRVDN